MTMRWMWMAAVLGVWANGAKADVPRVAVDIAPVHSIVAAVMGDLGTPALTVPPSASPHDHSMRPSEARALDSADLIFWIGPGLTPWLQGPLDTLGADATIVPLLDVPGTFQLEVREGAAFGAHDHDHGHGGQKDGHDDHDHDHDAQAEGHDDHAHDDRGHEDHGHEDHAEGHEDHGHDDHAKGHDDHAHDDHDQDAHGHDHGDGPDPHAWLDPQNAALWAQAIASALAEKDPENAATYMDNAATFATDLAMLQAEINTTLAPVRGRPFVVFHDAYHYFEHRFDIEALGAVTANDASAASPARLSELQASVQATGAVCALTEPQFNPGLLTALGPVKLGEIDPLGARLETGPQLYPALLRNMAATLASCLD